MNNYVVLTGTEAVERAAAKMMEAAGKMEAAADRMSQAVRDLDFALTNHRRVLTESLERFETAMGEVSQSLTEALTESVEIRLADTEPPAVDLQEPRLDEVRINIKIDPSEVEGPTD